MYKLENNSAHDILNKPRNLRDFLKTKISNKGLIKTHVMIFTGSAIAKLLKLLIWKKQSRTLNTVTVHLGETASPRNARNIHVGRGSFRLYLTNWMPKNKLPRKTNMARVAIGVHVSSYDISTNHSKTG